MNAGVITGVRVAHDRATVDEIEAACGADQRTVVASLLEHPAVSEAFSLQTCNRAEAYVVTDGPATGHDALADLVADVDDASVVWTSHEESLRHLLRVAAGLESLVLGEDQILGQVRSAYEDAREQDGIGYILEDALLKAIHVGERARTETAINEGVVSIGSAAVELAAADRRLESATALVVGAGRMGALAASAFAESDIARLLVANRTVETAERVTERVDVDAGAIGLDSLPMAAGTADVIVTATGSREPVLDAAALSSAGETTIIDIARPRDVDPAAVELPHVTVYDLDDLEAVTERTHREREAAATAVEDMIDRAFDRLLDQFKRKRADEVIGTMYEGAAMVKRRELEAAYSRLEARGGLSEAQREIIDALAESLINKLLSAPTKSLREAAAEDDWTTLNTALQLFDPSFDGAPVDEARGSRDRGDATDDLPAEVAAMLADDD